MYLEGSRISCGVQQLYDIGFNPTQAEYNRVMRECLGAAIVIASLTTHQTKEIKLLKKNGFKAVGRPITNPNSGNKILLFSKRFTKKERRKLGCSY